LRSAKPVAPFGMVTSPNQRWRSTN
jgi:hypothetical protein